MAAGLILPFFFLFFVCGGGFFLLSLFFGGFACLFSIFIFGKLQPEGLRKSADRHLLWWIRLFFVRVLGDGC